MNRFVFCLSVFFLIVGCSDTPEGIEPVSQSFLSWGYPDTVEVKATAIQESVVAPPTLPEPGAVAQKWLDKHSYVKVGSMEIDTSFAVPEEDAMDVMIVATQTYVHVD